MWTKDNHLYGSDAAPAFDERRRMLGMWMRKDKAGPVEGVRVFVSLDALWQLAPGCERDIATAIAIFARHRHKIEVRAANRFFDRGPEPNEFYRGRPVIVVTTMDLN